jgi:hypothetical protein
MKTREGSVPDLVRATRFASPGTGDQGAAERPITEELEAEDVDLDSDRDTGSRSRPVRNTMKTAEIDIARDRRITQPSPISAAIAAGMLDENGAPIETGGVPQPRPNEVEHTRRVGDSDRQAVGSGRILLDAARVAAHRQRAAAAIDAARAALDAGNLTDAVTAAEQAMSEADEAPPPGIVEVIEPARPFLTRVFATYVGPLSGVPVRAPRADEIARTRLGPRERVLMDRIDGLRSLEELFDGSGLGSTDALRIAARCLRAGAIRIV